MQTQRLLTTADLLQLQRWNTPTIYNGPCFSNHWKLSG
jgi:hypothetical protein